MIHHDKLVELVENGFIQKGFERVWPYKVPLGNSFVIPDSILENEELVVIVEVVSSSQREYGRSEINDLESHFGKTVRLITLMIWPEAVGRTKYPPKGKEI